MTDSEIKEQAKRVAEALVGHPTLLAEVIEILKKSWIPYAGPWVMTGWDGRWCRQGIFKDRMAAVWPRKAQGNFGWGIAIPKEIPDEVGLPVEFGVTGEARTIGEAANMADQALSDRDVTYGSCLTPVLPTVTAWSRVTKDPGETYFRLRLPERKGRVVAVGRDSGGLWGILFGDSTQLLPSRYADKHDAMRAADEALVREGHVLFPTDQIHNLEKAPEEERGT